MAYKFNPLTNKFDLVGGMGKGQVAPASSIVFTCDETTIKELGGISAGSSFPDGITLQDLNYKLLYPYVPPTVALTAESSTRIYDITVSNTVKLTAKATKVKYPVQYVGIQNGTEINKTNNPTKADEITHTEQFMLSGASKSFKAVAYDGEKVTESSALTFYQRYPIYYAKVTDLSSITADATSGRPKADGAEMSKVLPANEKTTGTTAKVTYSASPEGADGKIPGGYYVILVAGTLSDIKDKEGDSVAAAFTKDSSFSITLHGKTYNLYKIDVSYQFEQSFTLTANLS